MGCITSLLFLLNTAGWVFFNVVCWKYTGVSLGWISLVGIITFFIAWGLSGEATLAPRDYFWLTDWEIYVTKLKWANGVCMFIMGLMALLFIIFDWCGLREFAGISLSF